MKVSVKKILLLLLLSLAACDGGGSSGSKDVSVSGISVTPETSTILINSKLQLSAVITPTNASNTRVSWSSSNESIATVDQAGMVTAYNVTDTVRITAKSEDGGLTDYCDITVTDKKVDVETITITPATASMEPGEKLTLTVSYTPVNTTDRAIDWSSSDTAVATVDNGVVTALKDGSTTITATSAANTSIKNTSSITVSTEKQLLAISGKIAGWADAKAPDGNYYVVALLIHWGGTDGKEMVVDEECSTRGTISAEGDFSIALDTDVAAKYLDAAVDTEFFSGCTISPETMTVISDDYSIAFYIYSEDSTPGVDLEYSDIELGIFNEATPNEYSYTDLYFAGSAGTIKGNTGWGSTGGASGTMTFDCTMSKGWNWIITNVKNTELTTNSSITSSTETIIEGFEWHMKSGSSGTAQVIDFMDDFIGTELNSTDWTELYSDTEYTLTGDTELEVAGTLRSSGDDGIGLLCNAEFDQSYPFTVAARFRGNTDDNDDFEVGLLVNYTSDTSHYFFRLRPYEDGTGVYELLIVKPDRTLIAQTTTEQNFTLESNTNYILEASYDTGNMVLSIKNYDGSQTIASISGIDIDFTSGSAGLCGDMNLDGTGTEDSLYIDNFSISHSE